jgi:thiol:disulfide interchange protein DsbD
MPKPRHAESLRRLLRGLYASVAVAAALVGPVLLASHVGTAAAQPKLLPPEQAFRLSARALDTRTLEASFVIANGYYLYRDKLRFALETDGQQLEATSLPPGKLKDDEFFGRVETYRDRVVVRLPMSQPAAGRSVTLRTESQGCADAGVCYPPTVQRLTLAVPATDGRPGPLVDAVPAKKAWFK